MDGNGLLEYQNSTITIIQGGYRYQTLTFDDIYALYMIIVNQIFGQVFLLLFKECRPLKIEYILYVFLYRREKKKKKKTASVFVVDLKISDITNVDFDAEGLESFGEKII